MLLAHIAHEVLGGKMLAVIADSPSLPRREFTEAREIAEAHGFPLRIIQTQEFANPDYTANPVNRCYFCKHELFTRLEPIAIDGGCSSGESQIGTGGNAAPVALPMLSSIRGEQVIQKASVIAV